MTAPIHFEPTDPADLPIVPVAPDQWERIAGTLGASHVELGDGEAAVAFNGRLYLLAVA